MHAKGKHPMQNGQDLRWKAPNLEFSILFSCLLSPLTAMLSKGTTRNIYVFAPKLHG